jgi:uncharacterized RDD family membrane protein YckC
MIQNTTSTTRYAGLVRRLMAIIYDVFLLIALLFVATAVVMVFNKGAIERGQPLYPLYLVYLLTISFVFFGWFWTHGGQTLGMKTWKMRLQQENGQTISWPLAFFRFIAAIISWAAAGLGFLWSLFHPARRTWHDIASRSYLVDLRKEN